MSRCLIAGLIASSASSLVFHSIRVLQLKVAFQLLMPFLTALLEDFFVLTPLLGVIPCDSPSQLLDLLTLVPSLSLILGCRTSPTLALAFCNRYAACLGSMLPWLPLHALPLALTCPLRLRSTCHLTLVRPLDLLLQSFGMPSSVPSCSSSFLHLQDLSLLRCLRLQGVRQPTERYGGRGAL